RRTAAERQRRDRGVDAAGRREGAVPRGRHRRLQLVLRADLEGRLPARTRRRVAGDGCGAARGGAGREGWLPGDDIVDERVDLVLDRARVPGGGTARARFLRGERARRPAQAVLARLDFRRIEAPAPSLLGPGGEEAARLLAGGQHLRRLAGVRRAVVQRRVDVVDEGVALVLE